MNTEILHLDIPVLLPDVPHVRDQCVHRLQERLSTQRGIARVHLEQRDDESLLCLHFEPNLISLQQVRRLADRAGAELTSRYKHESLRVLGMDCGDCAASVEHLLGRLDGVVTISVSYAAEKLRIEYDSSRISRQDILDRINWMGYEVEAARRLGWLERNRELVTSLLAGLFLAVGFWSGRLVESPFVPIGLYSVAYVLGGYDVARHGLAALRHLRFDIDVLMLLAAAGAAALGQWAEGAFLLFLFSLGHSLEHYAMGRARHAIERLGEITPRTARVRREGDELEIAIEDVLRGDVVIVSPGERIPVDGEVVSGRSAVDQAPVTGEALPVEKGPGDPAFAGTLNGDRPLEIEVTKLARDTTLARIVTMVEEAQTQKSPTQRFTQRLERVFVPVALAAVLAVIVLPPIFGWLSWRQSLLRGVVLLVAASPCALAIATPSAVLSAVAQAARNGVLVKGGVYLEQLGQIRAIAFDKTGTITYGRPEVTDLIPFNGARREDLLRAAATVESRSKHPLAQAILRRAKAEGVDYGSPEDVQPVSGRGVRARLNGKDVQIGNLKMFAGMDVLVPEAVAERIHAFEAEGKTSMALRLGGRFQGVIALADQPRDEAADTFEKLKRLGVGALVMLTGDNRRVAAAIAGQVGLTAFKADLLPEQKVEAIDELLADHGRVAMVGDGVNDAPALARSTVGIAMGAGGSDVALESADVALMADDLAKLPFAVGLSRGSRRVILQNLVVSLGVVGLLVPLAAFGLAGIGPAIILHEGSTLLVVVNALRLLRYRERSTN